MPKLDTLIAYLQRLEAAHKAWLDQTGQFAGLFFAAEDADVRSVVCDRGLAECYLGGLVVLTEPGRAYLAEHRLGMGEQAPPPPRGKAKRRNTRRDAEALEEALDRDAEVYRLLSKNLTQAEVGKQLGISQSAVSKAIARHLEAETRLRRQLSGSGSVKAQALPTGPRGEPLV